MTYAAYEQSADSGCPIELYEFIQGTFRWTYTSHSESIVRLGQVYSPAPIVRDSIKQTTDIFKDGLTLTFPRDSEFAAQFLAFSPELPTTVTVYRGHLLDTAAEYVVYWKGRISSSKTSGNTIDLDCESVYTSIRRPGLRACFQLSCRRTLYLRGCNVNRELYAHPGTVLSIANLLNVTVSGASLMGDGYYTGGMLKTKDDVLRFITSHVGDVVTISRPLTTLQGRDDVVLYPGCDHLKETCNNKFNNILNFGGFPWIPTRNPYDGSSIV